MAAFSARQIAESAALSDHDALAVDFFADLDLKRAAKRSELVTGAYPDGFTDTDLIAALERVSKGENPLGFVYGAGFEDRPRLLEAIGERWPILGTGSAASARLKDPLWFAQLCDATGVLFPEIALLAPPNEEGWISKRIGGCGGSHIQWASDARPARDRSVRRYAQRFVRGEKWSLAALASRGSIRSLGFSRQWTAPSPDEPFRYGGAVGPLDPPGAVAETMRENLSELVRFAYDRGTALTGLLSADFVVTNGFVYCLEINARFGATVDVFDQPDAPLLKLHLDACKGRLPDDLPPYPGEYRAAGLAWAREPVDLNAAFVWPEWTRDRSSLPRRIEPGEPIATVYAEGRSADEAERLFGERVAQLQTGDVSETNGLAEHVNRQHLTEAL